MFSHRYSGLDGICSKVPPDVQPLSAFAEPFDMSFQPTCAGNIAPVACFLARATCSNKPCAVNASAIFSTASLSMADAALHMVRDGGQAAA